MSAEQNLWIAVLEDAFHTAFKQTHYTNEKNLLVKARDYQDIIESINFLSKESNILNEVCFFAGLDQTWVLKKYRQLVTSNFTLRDKKRFS